MQTLTIEVTSPDALNALHILEEKHFIRIVDDSDLVSAALPGSPLTVKAFKDWITNSEADHMISLTDAEKEWALTRKKLVELTR